MINSKSVKWVNSTNLIVDGAAITKGECRSAEGKHFDFTEELMNKILSNFNESVPIKIGHGSTPEVGRAFKMGFDYTAQNLPFEGHVYGDDNRLFIERSGYNKISPEIDFTFDASGNPIDGVITALALVKVPAMEGTEVTCKPMTFSAPSHPWSYDKDEKSSWNKPSLGDFTDKSWDKLSDSEKKNIAGAFAYSDKPTPSSYGDLKFPHHNPKSHAVVWSAVANAMARLNQANISESEKKDVYNHLLKHYKEFDKQAPAMFERCNSMKQEGIMVFYPKGASIEIPGETPSGDNLVVPLVAPTEAPTSSPANFEAEISKYKKMHAEFEAEIVNLKDDKTALETDVTNLNAQLNDYKTKATSLEAEINTFIQEKTDAVVAELKTMGFKSPETIAAELPAKQRIEVLKQMKSNFVITAPSDNPTQPVEVPKGELSAREKAMAAIPEELRKYIKSGV